MTHLIGPETGSPGLEPSETTAVYPLVSGSDDSVVETWLADHDSYRSVGTDVPVSRAEFDLCVVDTEALDEHGEALRNRKSSAAPVAVPVLLVLPEAPSRVDHSGRTEGTGGLREATVDEVVTRPLCERELEHRVGTLVRLRRQSRDLQAQRETVQFFREAVEEANHAVYITGVDGTIEYVNPAFEEVTGYSRSRAVGEKPRLLNSGEMPEGYFDELWETVSRGEVWDEEVVNRDESGGLYVARQTIAPVTDRNDEIRAFVATQSDISEQRERRQQLTRRTRAIERAPVGITVTDPTHEDNPLVYVNEAFVELTGYSRAEVLGRNCRFLQGEHTDQDRVAQMREAIDAGEPVSVELRNYRKDGSEFWSRVDIAPVRDDGEVANWVGFQQDITGRKQRQEQLSVLDRVLRHNLRNDLNVVRGWAEQIQSVTSGEPADYAGRILDASAELLSTVNKERAITEVLTEPPQQQEVDLCTTVGRAVTAVEREHPEATVAVSCPGGVAVRTNTDIGRAVRELLDNAVTHSGQDAPEASVTVTRDGEAARLAVTDDGPQIPEMERNVLVGEHERTPTYHGSGLGLWLVNLIVTRSGGQVSYETDGRGNTVSIEVPLADD